MSLKFEKMRLKDLSGKTEVEEEINNESKIEQGIKKFKEKREKRKGGKKV